MFKVIHYSKIMGLLILSMSSVAYSATGALSKSSSVYAGSDDARVNINLTRRDDSAIALLMKKSRDFKRINRKDQAAVIWERVLKTDPRNQQALAELATYRFELGDYAGTRKLLDALAKVNPKHPAIGEMNLMLNASLAAGGFSVEAYRQNMLRREKELLAKAADLDKQGKYAASAELYRRAEWLNPANPWATFGVARALLKMGNKQAAEDEIEQIGLDVVDGHYAYALFYGEDAQWDKVIFHINNIKEADKIAELRNLKNRANIYALLKSASVETATGKQQAAQNSLEQVEAILETNRSLDPEFTGSLCAAWDKLGKYDRSIAFLDKRQPLNEALQMYLVGLLLKTNQDARLIETFDSLANDHVLNFTNAQRADLDKTRIVVGVRQVDGLVDDFKSDEAFVMLQSLFVRFPNNSTLIATKERMDKSAINFAIAESEQYLRDDKIEEAESTLKHKLAFYPDNHNLLEMLRAVNLYKNTRIDRGINQAQGLVNNHQVYEAGQLISQLQHRFPEHELLATENQRIQKLVALEDVARTLAESEAAKMKSAEALRRIATADNYEYTAGTRRLRYIETGFSLLQKSGDAGLNKLMERDIPFAWHIPVKANQAEIIVKADHITLDAGDVSPFVDRFGYGNAVRHGTYVSPSGSYPIKAMGEAFSVAYNTAKLSADFGTSPAGFLLQNWVGGVRFNEDYKSTNFSIEATRRSVTDSVISFAGAQEPYGGSIWGGVARTGIQGAAYRRVADKLAIYASYGAYDYTGMNVADNSSRNYNGSLIFDLRQTDTSQMTISLALNGAHYNTNQNTYTWGNGAYYSPQNLVGVNIPWHLAGKMARLSYEVNLSVGRSRTVEDTPITYPTEALWQANYGNAQSSIITMANSYGLDWTLEYKINSGLRVGNTVKINNNDATYHQSSAMFYLKFDLDKSNAGVGFPTWPIKPYYLTTQGGVGHN